MSTATKKETTEAIHCPAMGSYPVAFYQPQYGSDVFYCKEYFLYRMMNYGYIYLIIKKSRDVDRVEYYFNYVNNNIVPFTYTPVKFTREDDNDKYYCYKIESPKAIASIYGVDLLGYCLKYIFNDCQYLTKCILSDEVYMSNYTNRPLVKAIYLNILMNSHKFIKNGEPLPNIDNSVFKHTQTVGGLFNLIQYYCSVTGSTSNHFDDLAKKVITQKKLVVGFDKSIPASEYCNELIKLMNAISNLENRGDWVPQWEYYRYRVGGPQIEFTQEQQEYCIEKKSVNYPHNCRVAPLVTFSHITV